LAFANQHPLRDAALVRIGSTFEPNGAAFYRGVYPLEAMARRGHDIVWPENDTGHPDLAQLRTCDVVFIYRRHEEALRKVLADLAARGIGIVWDNDDDFTAIPKSSPTYKQVGGLRGQQRFSESVRLARLADIVTVTTETLRDRYAAAGLENIRVIDNCLAHKTRRRRRKHDGIVVGWIAGGEHRGDARALELPRVLAELQDVHAELHVECVGVDLGLKQRYRHSASVHFDRLPDVMSGFDIGIAPLVESAFNDARSSIKVKEYAASAVPWLASPRLPYRLLGENHGGRLVGDAGWYDALDDLVRDGRARKRLARAGKSWAKRQTIDSVADQWESVFAEASDAARLRRP
jgi:glycosyltransferase involved in cell wall biosynthesis